MLPDTDPQEPADPANRARAMVLGLRLLRALALAGLAFTLIAVAILYGIIHLPGKQAAVAQDAGVCALSKAASARMAPLAHGEVAALALAKSPRPMPELSFNGPDGARKTLADFAGRTVLLNLWATWCIPCRQEMPALDRLQAALGGPDFEVVAVNIDTARLERPKAMLAEIGVKNLAFYADPAAEVFQTLRAAGKVQGLPTTIAVGADGCEIGILAGQADWGSGDALALMKAAMGG